jgi:hypothetical protein
LIVAAPVLVDGQLAGAVGVSAASMPGMTYTARRCSAMTGWQVLCAVAKSGPGARFLNLDHVRTASVCAAWVSTEFRHSCPAQCGGDPPQSIHTLFATGFLFVAQMVEDFRGA